ncbi:GAF domain-like protein [Phyllosticta citrichinensis]|uniref:GAF domain-like protein n=1 Tax=Phyllosticta citrichinensis TaxID=1130410 RepID=A0ABR1XH79_9PEZI
MAPADGTEGLCRAVHAESSTFARGITKAQAYAQVLEQAAALMDGQRNWVPHHHDLNRTNDARALSNLSNLASLLYHACRSLPAPSSAVNWCGFYVLDPSAAARDQLVLGPFQGHVACQTIKFGRGVCGTAAATKSTQLVPDVEQFPGHIACDGASKSEIVVPIVQRDQCVAIIDVDCAELGGFDQEDQKYLEQVAKLIAEGCDF